MKLKLFFTDNLGTTTSILSLLQPDRINNFCTLVEWKGAD